MTTWLSALGIIIYRVTLMTVLCECIAHNHYLAFGVIGTAAWMENERWKQ